MFETSGSTGWRPTTALGTESIRLVRMGRTDAGAELADAAWHKFVEQLGQTHARTRLHAIGVRQAFAEAGNDQREALWLKRFEEASSDG